MGAANRTIISLLAGTLVTVLASIVPALRATRVPPILTVREASTPPRSRFASYSPYVAGGAPVRVTEPGDAAELEPPPATTTDRPMDRRPPRFSFGVTVVATIAAAQASPQPRVGTCRGQSALNTGCCPTAVGALLMVARPDCEGDRLQGNSSGP